MSHAKAWFENLTTLSKIEGQRRQVRKKKMTILKRVHFLLSNLCAFASLRRCSGHAWREIIRFLLFVYFAFFAVNSPNPN